MTKRPKSIEAVMVEFMNDDNNWEWYKVDRHTTPKQAICEYLFENDLIDDETKVEFTEPVETFNPVYAKGFDVRAFYITIL